MGITFKSLGKCLPHVVDIRKPVLLRSRHGQGKSTLVYDFAKEIKMPVVERRASQMTEGDLLGLPKIDEDRTAWLPPDWLRQACLEPVVLFIDEIDRATMEVRQGFFELCDSRKIAGNHLHPDTLIFAAVNGGENTAQYQVGEMDPAELDRWTVFDLEPSVEDWLHWAKDNVELIVWDFINQNHVHLEHNSDFEPNKVYPSRRSWHRFSDCIQRGDLVKPGKTSPVLYNLACSFVGLEAATQFGDFVKNYKHQVTPENILDEGKFDLVKDFSINDHTSLVEKIVTQKHLQKKFTSKVSKNVVEYFNMLPSEVAMKFWTSIGIENSENLVKIHNNIHMRLVKMLNEEGVIEKLEKGEFTNEEQKTEEPKETTTTSQKK